MKSYFVGTQMPSALTEHESQLQTVIELYAELLSATISYSTKYLCNFELKCIPFLDNLHMLLRQLEKKAQVK